MRRALLILMRIAIVLGLILIGFEIAMEGSVMVWPEPFPGVQPDSLHRRPTAPESLTV